MIIIIKQLILTLYKPVKELTGHNLNHLIPTHIYCAFGNDFVNNLTCQMCFAKGDSALQSGQPDENDSPQIMAILVNS